MLRGRGIPLTSFLVVAHSAPKSLVVVGAGPDALATDGRSSDRRVPSALPCLGDYRVTGPVISRKTAIAAGPDGSVTVSTLISIGICSPLSVTM
ncbi:MAG: hypothetical protein J07HX5_01327 [halophilic archaeon J07HX5]|nr:MAG: hypothetical protein J07HX5_01327 [halophilic archaeon J07HX5]